MKYYDYIIIGAGCAGLSLLMRMLDDKSFSIKKVLLIDRIQKNSNDRTWCFWEKEKGYFEDIVCRKWDTLFFKDDEGAKKLDMGAYQYKMIKGSDFYQYCFNRIRQYPNIDCLYENVIDISRNDKTVIITTQKENIVVEAPLVFSSVFKKPVVNKNDHYLLQHFKGWLIKTTDNRFNVKEAVLMDFFIDQKKHPAAFMYMLPLAADKALIEYTVFSSEILPQQEYDDQLKLYIEKSLQIKEYAITHTEYGEIPMTNHSFPFYKNGIYYIGTAGGQTKASTGYTFRFIQKQSEEVAGLILNNDLPEKKAFSRFSLYDSILLRVLSKEVLGGKEIFSRLFKRIPARLLFKFLDNETSLQEELSILNAMPYAIFLPAAFKEAFKLVK